MIIFSKKYLTGATSLIILFNVVVKSAIVPEKSEFLWEKENEQNVSIDKLGYTKYGNEFAVATKSEAGDNVANDERSLYYYNKCPVNKGSSGKSSSRSRFTIENNYSTITDLIGNLDRVMNNIEVKKFECIVRSHLEKYWGSVCPKSDPQVNEWEVQSQALSTGYNRNSRNSNGKSLSSTKWDLDEMKILDDDLTFFSYSYEKYNNDGNNRERFLQASRVSTTNGGSGSYVGPPPVDGSSIIESGVSSTGRRRVLERELQTAYTNYGKKGSKKSSKKAYKDGKKYYESEGKKMSTPEMDDELLRRLRASDAYFDKVFKIVTTVTSYEETSEDKVLPRQKGVPKICKKLGLVRKRK